jgi:hypothetical protein
MYYFDLLFDAQFSGDEYSYPLNPAHITMTQRGKEVYDKKHWDPYKISFDSTEQAKKYLDYAQKRING